MILLSLLISALAVAQPAQPSEVEIIIHKPNDQPIGPDVYVEIRTENNREVLDSGYTVAPGVFVSKVIPETETTIRIIVGTYNEDHRRRPRIHLKLKPRPDLRAPGSWAPQAIMRDGTLVPQTVQDTSDRTVYQEVRMLQLQCVFDSLTGSYRYEYRPVRVLQRIDGMSTPACECVPQLSPRTSPRTYSPGY